MSNFIALEFWLSSLAIFIALLTFPGTIELLLLTLGGILPPRRLSNKFAQPLQHIAIVVPAHNEELDIARCVTNLLACDAPNAHFSVHVVADNCTDNTAYEAKQAGATVWVRNDDQNIGKGHALNFVFTELLKRNVDAVLVVDADTVVEKNFVQASEQLFNSGADAVQCRYTVNNPDAAMRTRFMHISLMAFNVLRPRGRQFWGLSVGISGNGFGLTRQALEKMPYTARSVVEDLEYHIALVKAGLKVQFVDATTVRADMPTGQKASDTQRARWEGGRFRMMREHIPSLLKQVFTGQGHLIEILLELLLLPLALHVLLLLALLIFPTTQIYALLALGLVVTHILAGIWIGDGQWKDVFVLAIAPVYILKKLWLFPKLLKAAGKETAWVRTDREKSSDK